MKHSKMPSLSELNEALEYNEVLTQIAAFASFSRSEDKILHSLPKDSLYEIQEALNRCKQAAAFLQAGGDLSMGGISDITQAVKAAAKGVTLDGSDLMAVAMFLAACRDIKKTFSETEDHYPILTELAMTIDECSRLFEKIMDQIDLSGAIKEDASAKLRSLYRKNSQLRADLAAKGKAFVTRNADSLMENMTTTIQGRMSVLLKASDKYKFRGMVHGSSSSGQAFYVEPAEFVELNNEIQSNRMEIEEEKKQILRELSRMVKSNANTILSDLETVSVIDVAFAKAKWMLAHDGCIPSIHPSCRSIQMEHAIHPLLEQSKAVPNTYELDENQKVLMMSGPNMGGKTVTLKTIGLFVVLSHAGFPLSAHKVKIPQFEGMYFDIGDNQSIENNLSTFSAHAARLAKITQAADDKTFVLLDEIGNGTDPLEGACLAQAVLEDLNAKGSRVVASTHYDEVKAYGKSDPSILVSSVEFDPETLKPTYRYLPGISGASYAFDIAESFPFKPSILQRARALKQSNQSEVQKQLSQLEKEQLKAQKKQERFDALIKDAHELQKKTAHEKEVLEKKKKRLDEEYEARLSAELDARKEEARKILKKIRKMNGAMNHEQIEAMAQIDQLRPDQKQEKRSVDESLKPGDYVHVEILDGHGEVVSVKKKEAVVLVNGKKITVSKDQLTRMKRPKVEKSIKAHKDRTFEAFPLELNLIGMRVEEAMRSLDHYLDQAVVHRIKNVRIIHGMGTGALRNAVWDDLKRRNSVLKYTSGGPGDGGLGATLVELK
ncbi:endonuclease MutS2 [Ileibacterium valens]|uniref:endonuclease MutS2 n=1 Tax=Ileibacterium valens TaxID=1862668 RepID=UPI002729DA43|nr:endonuclease MutS2 [Ileibacterium valens]